MLDRCKGDLGSVRSSAGGSLVEPQLGYEQLDLTLRTVCLAVKGRRVFKVFLRQLWTGQASVGGGNEEAAAGDEAARGALHPLQ